MFQARDLVEELKDRLSSAQAEYDGLRKAWSEYKASIAPIRKCPSEVTLMVFEFYLLENPRLVRRLLLVCKQWYEIACGAPQLWNRIPVEFNDDWNVRAVSEAINRRVEACIRRSGSLPLELHLDFRNLSYIRDKIASRLNTCMEDLIGQSPDYHGHLHAWMDSYHEADFQHLPESIQPAHALSILRKLSGDHGILACRWGSLYLRLPEHNRAAARQIWACFTCPTPNLTRMVILNFLNSDPGERYENEVAFPDLSSLIHLKADNGPGLERINAQSSPLQSLTVPGNLEYWASYPLSRFERLERLELRYDSSTAVLPAGELKFTFPKLRELTLHGEFKRLDMAKFRVPQLRFLNISQQQPMTSTRRTPYLHPKLQPIFLCWQVMEGWEGYWSKDYIRSELREAVLQYPTAEHFRTQLFLRGSFILIVRKLYMDGNLPSALKSVTFEGEVGQLETVDLRDLLLLQ